MDDGLIIAGSVGALFLALFVIAFGIPFVVDWEANMRSVGQKVTAAAVSSGMGIPDISGVRDVEIKVGLEEALDAVRDENYTRAEDRVRQIELLLIEKNLTVEHDLYSQVEDLAREGKYGEARELAENLIQKLS